MTIRLAAPKDSFTMGDVIRESDRLRFSVDVTAMWEAWCKGQALITVAHWDERGQPVSYSCAGVYTYVQGQCEVIAAYPDGGPQVGGIQPDGGIAYLPPPILPVDCGVEATCTAMCSCAPGSCGRGAVRKLLFDLHIQDGEADGTSDLGNVHLKPQ
jgi:hypothetical protein